ncbi:MAG: hypothetical protein LBB25_00305 [Holosporaceae bacterium]|nr:hypothetical protein [Holosporaceae bacterium]
MKVIGIITTICGIVPFCNGTRRTDTLNNRLLLGNEDVTQAVGLEPKTSQQTDGFGATPSDLWSVYPESPKYVPRLRSGGPTNVRPLGGQGGLPVYGKQVVPATRPNDSAAVIPADGAGVGTQSNLRRNPCLDTDGCACCNVQ